jgi:hypothetical protein
MANDNMFTTRSGKQVPVPAITIPSDMVMSAMRAQEDYLAKGKRYGLSAILLDWMITGKDTLAKRAKNAAKNRDNKNTGKAVKEYIRIQLVLRKPIDPLVIAELSGIQVPSIEEAEETESVEVAELDTDLTDSELDAATSPNGPVS